MNKKVYIQPQIFFVPLQTESLLQTFSNTQNSDNTGGKLPGGGVIIDPNNPNGGKEELSKEHFNDYDSWDSWD